MLTVAPNGGRKTKADHPALPLTADELARTAAECLERGASMIHLHVRDAEGQHCLDPEAYRATIAQICQEVGDRLVLQITSESLGHYSPAEQRAAVLKTNPEAVSLALRELAPEAPDEKDFCVFLGKLKQMRVWPQIILYTPAEAERLGAMVKQGLIPFDRLAVLYVLGRYSLTRTASAARPPAVPRPGHAAVRIVERVRIRPPRGGLRDRRRAARGPCAGRLREQPQPTRRRPRRLERRTGRPPLRGRSKRSGFRPKPRTACGRRSRRRWGRDLSQLCGSRIGRSKQSQEKPSAAK